MQKYSYTQIFTLVISADSDVVTLHLLPIVQVQGESQDLSKRKKIRSMDRLTYRKSISLLTLFYHSMENVVKTSYMIVSFRRRELL